MLMMISTQSTAQTAPIFLRCLGLKNIAEACSVQRLVIRYIEYASMFFLLLLDAQRHAGISAKKEDP